MEYKILHSDTLQGLEDLLNEYGKEGWSIDKFQTNIDNYEWQGVVIIKKEL